MSGSCCGGASKAEPTKVAIKSAPQNETLTEQAAAKSTKSECCKDEAPKGEKHGCGC